MSFGYLSNMNGNLSNKYSQKLDSAKQLTMDAIKTASERVLQKTAKATADLIGNKIADKTAGVSKKSSKISRSEELHSQNEDEIETPKERYIPPEKRQQIIDKLRLV